MLTFQTRGKNMRHFQMHHAVQLSTKQHHPTKILSIYTSIAIYQNKQQATQFGHCNPFFLVNNLNSH